MTSEWTEEQESEWMETWLSDIRQFLLSDEECMQKWIAFRQNQKKMRAEGIDTTKPRHMIKISDYVLYCPPSEQDK